MSYVLSATEVMDLIPNRYPICYLDYVVTLEPGPNFVVTYVVTINEDFFQGAFPDNPVMPGVLLLETLAPLAYPQLTLPTKTTPDTSNDTDTA
ncbi:hypothetical protein KYX74_05465, partial [Enterococcus lactis]|nr:hypothetical protein [Enterococcus lactis]